MKTILYGNDIHLEWGFTDAVTGLNFDFAGVDIKLTLFSCNKVLPVDNYTQEGGTINAIIPTKCMPCGVYTAECEYSVGMGVKRAKVRINDAFQISNNKPWHPEEGITPCEMHEMGTVYLHSIAMPIITSKIAMIEYLSGNRYNELKGNDCLKKRTIYVVEKEGEKADMYLYKYPLSSGSIPGTIDWDDIQNKPDIPEAYVLPIAKENELGGIKASPKTENETTEVKIGEDGKLYAPEISKIRMATENELGGIKASPKTDCDTVEIKIGEDGKLYGEKGVGGNPDNEDLCLSTNSDGKKVLKFNNKSYDASLFSGLGRVYLRKNIVFDKNKLIQDMINFPNTIYIIQYDYDLVGGTINIPSNCVLDFQGGSIKNGTINLNGCYLNGIVNFNKDVVFSSTVKNTIIYPEWFGAKGNGINNDTVPIQNAINVASDNSEIYFIGKYKIFGISEHKFNRRSDGIHIKSGITFKGGISSQLIADDYCCNIFTTPPEANDLTKPNISNVRFYNLELVHTHSSIYQFSALINLANIDNCIIQGCKFLSYCGDGITIGALLSPDENRWMTSFANDITIRDCIFDGKNIISRQGISVYVCNNITIDNNVFKNSSGDVMPGAIDFEPEADVEIKNVKIINNHFENIKGVVGTIAFVNPLKNSITADRFIIENNTFVSSNSHDIYIKMESQITCSLIITKNTFIKSKVYFLVDKISDVIITYNIGGQLKYGNAISNSVKANYCNNITGDQVGMELWNNPAVTFDNCGAVLIDGNFHQRINTDSAFKLGGTIGSAIIVNNRVNAWEASNVKFVELAESANLDRYIFKNNLCGAPSDIGEYNDLSSVSSYPFNLDTLPDSLPIGIVSTVIGADSINKSPLNAEGGLLLSVHPTNGYYKGLTKQLFFPMFVRGEQPNSFLFIRKRMDNNTWSEWKQIVTENGALLKIGDSASRPNTTSTPTGFMYFDTTLGKPLWVNSKGEWVSATGQ